LVLGLQVGTDGCDDERRFYELGIAEFNEVNEKGSITPNRARLQIGKNLHLDIRRI
jgi:hypothetical protein